MLYLIMQAKQFFSQFRMRGEKGQGLVEYALIILLVSIVVIGVLTLLGTEIRDVFDRITDVLSPAT